MAINLKVGGSAAVCSSVCVNLISYQLINSHYALNQYFSTAGPRLGTGPWHQLYRAARGSPETYGIKTNWCHYFNFIYILLDLYMFRAHRPILRRVHTAVHTTIGSYGVCTALAVCSAFHRYQLFSHKHGMWLRPFIMQPQRGLLYKPQMTSKYRALVE